MCHPERSEESPLFSPKMRCFASLSMTGWRMSPRASFFVAPSEARGPLALTCLGRTKREACLGRTRWEMSPRASFFCHPEALAEGSHPWGRRSERSEEGRRPERSEGCLAIARQDNKKDARQDKVGRGLF
jgi:hypothetical protein